MAYRQVVQKAGKLQYAAESNRYMFLSTVDRGLTKRLWDNKKALKPTWDRDIIPTGH